MHREPECYSAADERAMEEDEAMERIEAFDREPNYEDFFGGDTCAHCGATAVESFDCALNGCRFGLIAESDDRPTPPQSLEDSKP